jgi:hypothetical protein
MDAAGRTFGRREVAQQGVPFWWLMKRLLSIALLLIGGFVRAETGAVIGPFSGLNDTDNSLIIGQNQAQDLLNVEISPGGKSVLKRRGFGQAFATDITTSPIHGTYSFYDATGNEVALAFNDSRLTASVNGATPTTLFSTGTVAATWQCTDSLGYAYCASSAREPVIKTNGATYSQFPMTSTGTMVTATTQRLATAGFSGTPSQINLSKANDFATWATGPLATDAYTETISAPGSRITHITHACGNLVWFKNASFGMLINPDDQFNAQNVTVSPTIGTLDNSSVYYNGILHFRSQDGHFYDFDCASLQKMSSDIENTVGASGNRIANSWTETAQTDWDSGAFYPEGNFSTTISDGDIILSSFTNTDTSGSDFDQGYFSGIDSTTYAGSLALKRYISSDTFSNLNNWSQVNGTMIASSGYAEMTDGEEVYKGASITSIKGDITIAFDIRSTGASASGEDFQVLLATSTDPGELDGYIVALNAVQASNIYDLYLTTTSVYGGQFDSDCVSSCGLSVFAGGPPLYISSSTLGSFNSSYHTIKFTRNNTTGDMTVSWDGVNKLTATNTAFDTFKNIYIAGNFASGVTRFRIDNFYAISNKGNYTSDIFDLNMSSSIIYGSFDWTIDISTPEFGILTASNSTTGPWTQIATSSGSNSTSQRYIKYTTTITAIAADTFNTKINDIVLVAKSTGGVFYSAVNNAPNLSEWDVFTNNEQTDGGTIEFYIRSDTNTIAVWQSTPSWVSQQKNSIIVASTGTYFQVRADFSTVYATNTLALNDLTLNWFEGTASDKIYGTYFDNAIWWAVQKGEGATANNAILRYELENQGWTIFDIPANGFYLRGDDLYFGSSTSGYVYKFGDSDSDNGSAINSYWKSKDFFGNDPFTENEYRKMSVSAKMVADSSMTVTYTTNGSSSTSYTVPLYSATSNFIKNNRNLPAGRTGSYLNVQIGNNAAEQPWEVFGIGYTYEPKPWRPGN